MTTQNTLLNSRHNCEESIVSPQFSKEQINVLHREFQTYGRNAKHWIRKCQLLLPKIRDEEVWKKKGFSSIYEYAAKLAGMSHNSVNEALRVLDKLENKPLLKEKVEKYGINRVKPVVAIATELTEDFWAEKIDELAQKPLETYVREYKLKYGKAEVIAENVILRAEGQRIQSQDYEMSNGVEDVEGSMSTQPKISMYMKLDVKTIEQLKKIKGDRDWNEVMKDLLRESRVKTEEGLEQTTREASASNPTEEPPAPINTGKRYIPAKIKKHVIKKTSGCCAYPGCTKPYEILHHTKRFALDSTHDTDTLVALCKAHERIAHAGLIENEEDAPVEVAESGWMRGCSVGEALQVNWSLKKLPDTNDPKYRVDRKVNQYYTRE